MNLIDIPTHQKAWIDKALCLSKRDVPENLPVSKIKQILYGDWKCLFKEDDTKDCEFYKEVAYALLCDRADNKTDAYTRYKRVFIQIEHLKTECAGYGFDALYYNLYKVNKHISHALAEHETDSALREVMAILGE